MDGHFLLKRGTPAFRPAAEGNAALERHSTLQRVTF